MSYNSLKSMSVSELTQRFTEIALAQDQALLRDEVGKFNQLFDRMVAVEEELKERPEDERRALIGLYNRPDLQVRLNAAKATLAIDPSAARKILEAIEATGWQPQAGDAGMCLWALERGIFSPT